MSPRATETFFKSESRYRMLVENSSDIIFSLDFEGYFAYVSPAWKNILGHELSEVIGHNFREFVDPEDIPRCEDIFMAVLRTNAMQEMTYRVQHADGSWRRHNTRVNRHRDENGVQTVFGTAHDVTDRFSLNSLFHEPKKWP